MYLNHTDLNVDRYLKATQHLMQVTGRMVNAIDRYFNPHFPQQTKPDWVHLSDRTWNRHSAFLTARREQAQTLDVEQ
jgi:hypothetical protein